MVKKKKQMHTLFQLQQVTYLYKVVLAEIVISWARRRFEGALVCKMICFIQFTEFSFICIVVVKWQAPTVFDTPHVTLNWTQCFGTVKDMANKLWILHRISMHIKWNFLTCVTEANALNLQKKRPRMKKLRPTSSFDGEIRALLVTCSFSVSLTSNRRRQTVFAYKVVVSVFI